MENEHRILTDSDVFDRLRKDIIIVLYHQPFFAYFLSKMKKVLDKRVPVAGVSVVNGDITLHINPEGYLSYTREERTFILIHEVMHIIYYHHIREKNRHHGLWNVATDLAINQLIETNYAHMPIDCLRLDSWEKKHGFRLPQKLTAEGYYKIVWEKRDVIDIPEHMLQGALGQHLAEKQKEQQKQPKQPQRDKDGNKEENKEEHDDIQGLIEDLNEEEKWLVVNQTTYKVDKTTTVVSEEGEWLELEDLEVGLYVSIRVKEEDEQVASVIVVLNENDSSSNSSDSSGSGDTNPFDNLHPTWNDSTEVGNQLAESIVRSAVQEAYKEAHGEVPYEIQSLIQELVQPKVEWKSILHNFIAKKRSTSKQGTWKKRNRRLGNTVMGYKKNRKLVVAVAIDTSASITDEDFKTFYTEIINIAQNGATIILIECDAAVHNVEKFSKHHTPQFVGGGGTDFRPVFNAIEEKEHKLLLEKPDALLFFTDGYGIAPDTQSIPTLWCLTKNGQKPMNKDREEIAWGNVLYVS